MDRFAEVEVFVRIVETGGIGAAARRMDVAKSVVSRRLRDLEDRVGGRLINRTTRQFSLTETGRVYYERVSKVLEDLEEADQAALSDSSTLTGTMRVAAPMTFGVMHLAPAIADFLSQHEHLRIDLELNDRFVDLVEEGFDVAVRIGALSDSSLMARKLAPVRNALMASPGFIAKYGRPQQAGDLNGLPALHYTGIAERNVFQVRTPQGDSVAVRPDIRMRANNGEMLRKMAEAGLGFLINPTFISADAVDAGKLEILLPDYGFDAVTAYAIYPPGRNLSTKVRAFIDFLVGRFGEQPYWDHCLDAALKTAK
ncbi:MAG: LysR family transcriptional regulator [Rhodobiaceae bacterium]|nr:LysR family transcriptional regulator [Rhodobiaceae bacterium]MCC0018754.1 LysR family transcriptional regulator [Rhodobiaceae bacterium]MCC0061301.1 LysR family transcriptional regulator [Rhodobiaceae bacterium]